jgi:hypothetical protein
MGQIFSTLFYLVIGYVVGLLLAPAGLFSLTIAATQWGHIITWVYLLFWPFMLIIHFMFIIIILAIVVFILWLIAAAIEKIT